MLPNQTVCYPQPCFCFHWNFELVNLSWGYLKLLFNTKVAWESKKAFIGSSHFQFSSVTQLCPTLCNPMDCSTPGLPVPEFTQTHVRWVGDAIQPSHPLSSPSPPAFSLSQLQGLFQWVSSLHQVAKVLEFQLQHQSFQWTPRTDLLQNGLVGSPCSPRDSQESPLKPQFKSINSLALSQLFYSSLSLSSRGSFYLKRPNILPQHNLSD